MGSFPLAVQCEIDRNPMSSAIIVRPALPPICSLFIYSIALDEIMYIQQNALDTACEQIGIK